MGTLISCLSFLLPAGTVSTLLGYLLLFHLLFLDEEPASGIPNSASPWLQLFNNVFLAWTKRGRDGRTETDIQNGEQWKHADRPKVDQYALFTHVAVRNDIVSEYCCASKRSIMIALLITLKWLHTDDLGEEKATHSILVFLEPN